VGERPKTSGNSVRGARGFSRELVLVVCFLSLIALLGATAFVSRMYHKRVHTLADQWFEQGETDYNAGDAKKALIDYRNALVFSPSNKVFQFHLASALAANGQLPEARAYLLPLLSDSPGSGEINLALARIAAHQSKMQDAMLYYNSAIYGEWPDQPIEMRWNVRRELCEFLLSRGASSQAEPALVALADNTPDDDIDKQKAAGKLLLAGQLWNRALDEYRSVLAKNRNDADALEGAGTAAYNLGYYSQAVNFLGRLPRDRSADPKISTLLETSRLVEASDPFLEGLSIRDKARRTVDALNVAETRAHACMGAGSASSPAGAPHSELGDLLATAQQAGTDWSVTNLIREPDRINTAMDLVFRIENAAEGPCGEPTGEDRALWLIGRSVGNNHP